MSTDPLVALARLKAMLDICALVRLDNGTYVGLTNADRLQAQADCGAIHQALAGRDGGGSSHG